MRGTWTALLSQILQVIHVSDNERPMDSPAISTPTTVATDEQIIDVSSGPSTHDKNTRKKRMAKAPANRPKSKKQKFVDEVEAMYEKYIMHGKTLKRTKKDEQPKPFVKIGGFYIGYKKFLACLKPRGDMNDEVMSLCIETFNLAHLKESNRTVKKFMFSVHMADRLKQDPSNFQPSIVMAEYERATKKCKVQKHDLLFFTIVNEHHWIVVCANLLHKQWNVFDSVVAKGKQSILKRVANNLITNFATLAQEFDENKIKFASFPRVDIVEYPKQNNLCDCGFFGLLYAENFDGKVMKEFSKDDIPLYRKKVAHRLMTHPLNNAPMESAFKDDLAG